MRLGGPIFTEANNPEQLVAIHRKLGYSAAYCRYIAKKETSEQKEYIEAFKEADIILAEYDAFYLNISDPDPKQREANIVEIINRLRLADEMGALCCVIHGGSYSEKGCCISHKDNFSEANIEHHVQVIQRIIDEVQPKTTKLTLETESYVLPDSPDVYLRLIQEIDRKAFAAHLDPINMTLDPRRVYYNGDFIRDCFHKLGPYIASCHAKDTNLIEHATVQITETYAGNGMLDYDAYLTELSRLSQEPPLMIERVREEELPAALNFIFGKAESLGLSFKHAEKREAAVY